MSAKVVRLGEDPDPDRRIRQAWGESLADHMKAAGLVKKARGGKPPRPDTERLSSMLSEIGITASRQAIDGWLAGEYAPRPHVQVALGRLFRVPPHRLFPLEQVA